MDIVVVSDTHGYTGFIEKLVKKHPNAYMYLHAGDSCLREEELYPFETVKGNCDYYINNRIKLVNIYGIKILMFHGNGFILDLDMLVNYAKNYDAQILIHGHTHIPYVNYVNGVHIICPGSVCLPRVTGPTYALIHINSADDIKVEIINYENRQ